MVINPGNCVDVTIYSGPFECEPTAFAKVLDIAMKKKEILPLKDTMYNMEINIVNVNTITSCFEKTFEVSINCTVI